MGEIKELFFILTKNDENCYNALVKDLKEKKRGELYVFKAQALAVVAMNDEEKKTLNTWPIEQQKWIKDKIDVVTKNIEKIENENVYLILHDKDVLGGRIFSGRLDFSSDIDNPLHVYKKIYAFSHTDRMGTYLFNAPIDEKFLINLKNEFFNE